jgi:hypothetical protein
MAWLKICVGIAIVIGLGFYVGGEHDQPLVYSCLKLVYRVIGPFEVRLIRPVRWVVWSVLSTLLWWLTCGLWSRLTASPSVAPAIEPVRERPEQDATVPAAGAIVPVTYAPPASVAAPTYSNCGNVQNTNNHCQSYASCTFAARQPASTMESHNGWLQDMKQLLKE